MFALARRGLAMEPTMPGTLEQRIRARAHQIWEQEGRPQGREHDHWEKARILVSIEDDKSSLKPVEPERPEPAQLMENLGEFPSALTDEGDRQQVPSRKAKAPAARNKAAGSVRRTAKKRA
jgi:hypothetical protein